MIAMIATIDGIQPVPGDARNPDITRKARVPDTSRVVTAIPDDTDTTPRRGINGCSLPSGSSPNATCFPAEVGRSPLDRDLFVLAVVRDSACHGSEHADVSTLRAGDRLLLRIGTEP
jgi:hypothetical protein